MTERIWLESASRADVDDVVHNSSRPGSPRLCNLFAPFASIFRSPPARLAAGMSPRTYEIEAGGVDAVYLAHRETAKDRSPLSGLKPVAQVVWFVEASLCLVVLLSGASDLRQTFIADALMSSWIPNFGVVV